MSFGELVSSSVDSLSLVELISLEEIGDSSLVPMTSIVVARFSGCVTSHPTLTVVVHLAM